MEGSLERTKILKPQRLPGSLHVRPHVEAPYPLAEALVTFLGFFLYHFIHHNIVTEMCHL